MKLLFGEVHSKELPGVHECTWGEQLSLPEEECNLRMLKYLLPARESEALRFAHFCGRLNFAEVVELADTPS